MKELEEFQPDLWLLYSCDCSIWYPQEILFLRKYGSIDKLKDSLTRLKAVLREKYELIQIIIKNNGLSDKQKDQGAYEFEKYADMSIEDSNKAKMSAEFLNLVRECKDVKRIIWGILYKLKEEK
jgi:hypothetical protein